MYNNPVSFIKVTTNEVLDFIASAKKRIIFAKPSFFKNEIKAIIDTKNREDIFVEIYMEAGESAIRYGFGETSALELISANIVLLDTHIADRIRIAILIVDNNALVYMPNLSFIEEESNALTFPNGFLCNEDVTEDIFRQFTAKNSDNIIMEKLVNVLFFPGVNILSLNSDAVINNIDSSIKNLKNNPAIDPSNLEKINFYRNNYKIVKMQVWGIRINNKSLNIKPFYSLLAEKNERLKSSWNIFTQKDITNLQDTKLFERELNKIIDEYKEFLFDAGRFGSIIDVKKKVEFISSINKLKEDFQEYLRKQPSDVVKARFKIIDNDKEKKIQKMDFKTVLENSREQLEAHLLKLCSGDAEFLEKVFSKHKYLKKQFDDKKKNKEEIIKEFVSLFVLDVLKFPEVEDIIEKIDIKLDWYDVSDELLFENEDFKKIIEHYDLDVRINSTGYEGIEKHQSVLI